MTEWYMPASVFKAYAGRIDVDNIPMFMQFDLYEDVKATVLMPPVMSIEGIYGYIKRKLWGKRLCKDIKLTNRKGDYEYDEDDSESYYLDEGDYKIYKFYVIERIINTHIIFKGCYNLLGSLSLKKGLISIPFDKIPSRRADKYLAQKLREFRRIVLFSVEDCRKYNIWLPNQVKGFAASFGFSFNSIYQYCFARFVVYDENASELGIKLSEQYMADLEREIHEFERKVSRLVDEWQSLKEHIIEDVVDVRSLALRLLKERGSIAITPDILHILDSYGFKLESFINELNKLAEEGIVIKHPEGWKLASGSKVE